jgi:hypothetical protein
MTAHSCPPVRCRRSGALSASTYDHPRTHGAEVLYSEELTKEPLAGRSREAIVRSRSVITALLFAKKS